MNPWQCGWLCFLTGLTRRELKTRGKKTERFPETVALPTVSIPADLLDHVTGGALRPFRLFLSLFPLPLWMESWVADRSADLCQARFSLLSRSLSSLSLCLSFPLFVLRLFVTYARHSRSGVNNREIHIPKE